MGERLEQGRLQEGDNMEIAFIGLVIIGYIALLLIEGLVYGAIAELIGRMVRK